MSNNNQRGSKTITGEDTLEIDELNIVGDGIGINGNFGQAGQVIKKSSIDNSIVWENEEDFTATLPLVLTGNQFSFNSIGGENKVAIRTETEKRVLELGNNSSTHYIKLQENNGLIMCSLIDCRGNLNVLDSGGITFYSDAGSTPFIEISKSHFLPTANMPTYAIGNSTHPIHTINCRELTSQNVSIFSGGIKQATSGATFSITSLGTGDFTAINVSGNINANGNIVGDGNTDISGIDVANMGSLTLSGNINANGNIVGDGNTGLSGIKNIDCFSLTASSDITANGNIVGDSNTDISGINNATITNLTATNTIALIDNNSYIDMNGGYIDMSGGNISMNSGDILGCNLLDMSGNIDMNGNDITELTDISYNNSASTFSGGSASNKVVFTNCDLSSATNTAPAVPSFISGNKTFNGDVIFQGNVELGNSDSDIIEQIGVYHDFKSFDATNLFTENIDHHKRYFGESVSNTYTYKTNILNGTHFAPYGSHRLSQSNTKSGGFPYRSKKLFPTDFMANDDTTAGPSGSSHFASIVDSGTYGTSGFSNNGGIKINNSVSELWTYFDVPEGMSLESVYLRVFDSMGQRLARNVKVFKKPMGLLGGDQRHQIKLIDANTIAAATTLATDWLGNEVGSGLNSMFGEVFYEQDCINEYDSCMAVRVSLTSTSDTLIGGYALFRPNESLDYSITVSVGVMFHSSFTINFNGINGVVSHTFTGSGQSAVITLPYDYAMSRNSSQGSVLQVVGGSGRTYSFSALTNGSFDSIFERLDTPTTSTTFSAPSGTMNTHLIRYRQEVSFSINQS